MRLSHLNVRSQSVIAVFLVAACAAYFIYQTSGIVSAYRETKNAYVFPTIVTTTGWANGEAALSQELSGSAPFSAFTKENSAYVAIAPGTAAPQQPDAPASEAPAQPESAEGEATTSGEGATPAAEAPTAETPTAETPTAETPVEEAAPEAPVTETTAPDPVPAPAPESAAPEANAGGLIGSFAGAIADWASIKHVFAQESEPMSTTSVETAPESAGDHDPDTHLDAEVPQPTTDESGPSGNDDVPTCFLQQKECHTITLFGFGVTGEMTETNFRKASLNFSFAAGISEADLVDDKLEVRYFHAGKWREAGEIFLNKEMSNAANGGFFTAELEEIESWSDLDDVKVVIEYDRNNTGGIELYVDAVWIDTEYRETLSEIIGEDEAEGADIPENVMLALSEGDGGSALILGSGERIEFSYIDDLDETLVFRADNPAYATDGDDVYASITNTSGVSENVSLYFAFPRGFGSVIDIQQLKRNVPETTEVPVYQEVTYLCENGWIEETAESASSTEPVISHRCASSGEIHACASLNTDRTNCTVSQVQVGSESAVTYEHAWVPVPFATLADDEEGYQDQMPDSYKSVSRATEEIEIMPGQTVHLKFRMQSSGSESLQFAIFAHGSVYSGDLVSELLEEESVLRGSETELKNAKRKGNMRLFGRADFDGDEMPAFKFAFKSKRNFVAKGINALLGRGNDFSVEQVKFMRGDGIEETIPVAVEYGEDGTYTIEIKTHPRSFRPGKYTAEITLREGSDTFTESVEFYWGILAINTTQSMYAPGDVVPIALAALDEAGDTICDADLRLSAIAPDGTAQELEVEQSGLCGDNNVIDVADYLATYQSAGPGVYRLIATEYDARGYVVHRVFDSFEVRENSPFTIKRTGMTRIYPVASYRMNLELTAANDFEGEFIEAVPPEFEIVESDGAEIRMYGGAKNLAWAVSLKAGETMRVSYVYDAPDISPYMYLLGPAEVRAGEGIPFKETRQWKIASDATGNMLLYWDAAYIPAGWTCVSCVPADNFYQRFILGSSTPGINGGTGTSTHTATGAVTNSGGTQNVGATATAATPVVAHTHTLTPAIASTSSLPLYRNLMVIQYNSAGEPPSIPAGAIALFDAAVPSGWTAYTAQNGRFARGSAFANVTQTGGSDTHVHSVTGTTGAAATTVNVQNPGTAIAVAAAAHTHTIAATATSSSHVPPYIETIFGKLNATSTPTNDMIAMWTGDAPTGWSTVSSSSEPFENRFPLASSTYGATGGTMTHTHSNLSVTSSGPSATANRANVNTTAVSSAAHTHTVSVTAITTDTNLPLYRTAVFAKRVGGSAPPSPSLHDRLFDNEKMGTSTPSLEFTAYDPDGADTLIYQFQWDDDSDLSSSPLGDRTSDVETGCSPNCFQNVPSPGDTSPFNDGERIRFTIQTPLVSGTTYFWRARARESGGGGVWGAWSTTTSFTYVANISPSQWFQTEDGQFDSNTLSGAETYGSGSARLQLAAQTEAMIVYGEGVVQTPRYRIWNGTAWSSELSASNVGGTVNWVSVKGGTTRDEYVMGTQDASNDVNVQVFNGTTDTWGTVTEVTTTVANAARRGFDVAYETVSGDALVVYCDGDADPSYRVWNGSSWSGATTINLTSANNCEYIKLASDPLSDEIILVSRDTGATYEAQVWTGSAWGNARQLGSMIDTANEGIGLEYEASGDQAIIAVSNGAASSFAWTSWNGTEWSINTTQALGDDFEWGALRADDGSDNMALCYIDQDADIGVVRWDGNAWIAFSERDTGGNANSGKANDCAFETTAGRDGFIMDTYSDTTNARYQVWNGTTWAAEATISTIQDATTVETIRTGDGLILSVFNDDVNTQFDFSYWNGTAWSTIDTLEGTPSVAAAPFLQPFSMAPKIFTSSSGTMTSGVIDFDQVPGRQQWGEVLWRTTEPNGTDVTVQVLYETGGVCNTLVPNGTLPGNAAGFQATTSPVNISGLSTSTYNRICLRATFSTTNDSQPSLEEWTVTWQRQAYLTQTHFRWYVNSAASLTPSDPWPSGGNDLSEDVAIPAAYSPSPNDVLRLRMSLLAENVSLQASALSLKLQYAAGASCSAGLTWHDVGAIGSTTAAWRGYNNASLSDGATLPSNLIISGDARATYEEENDSALNPNIVSTNDEGEWDWVLQHNSSANVQYCFRAVTSGGEVLNEYDVYPALVTNSAPGIPELERPFNNEAVASTSPWFEFAAEDPESDDITYQIQVDDDSAFGSPNIDRDSQNFIDDFTNLVTTSDKDPFTTAQSVRYVPTSALTNGVTYYWRVRAKDRTRSNEWSSWSTVQSVTIDTSVTISTWRQTTLYQFSENGHEDTEATSTNDIILTPPQTVGTTTGTMIDFDWRKTGNAWGSLSFTDVETSSDAKYRIEYYNETSEEWELVPDTDLAGNSAGFDTSPVSLLSMSPTIYNQIRIVGVLTNSGATPRVNDWQIAWGLAVEQPQVTMLFDNEKTATTTPTFRFVSGDPQNNDLVYELSISTTQNFTSSTTRRSSLNAGFTNTASSSDTSPFTQDDLIQFKLQAADALTNGTTYWWRVRAIDPTGGNVWSVWSDLRSFTVDTSVGVSTWFQTTNEQWTTNTLSNIETSGGSAQITSVIREAFTAYSEGTVQLPRFRIWNGVTWGNELTGVSIGDTIRFVEVDSATTRDEYAIATMGSTGVVDVQIVNGATDTAGNSTEIVAAAPDVTQRGYDIAYETNSGDLIAVACSGTEATYKVWNGSSWSVSTAITLAVTANCEWIKLVSDPTSDEIILVARDATTGATDYNALVWNGSAWGNSVTFGSQVTVTNEGIAVEYEESGGQAIVAVSNGANNNFIWNSWNGSAWAGTATVAIGNDFANGRLVRDDGSDNMTLCYVDIDNDIGYSRWNGSSFSAITEFELTGNSNNSRPVSCEYETSAGRDGYIMMPYSDTIQAEYVFWDGAALSTAALLTTVSDAAEIRTVRTGDGLILALAYDDANTEYDFTYWNGTAWSAEQVLEGTSITTVVPPTIPLDIVARRYPAFVAGTVESTAIDFDDGTGPKWGAITFSKTTPGSSSVTVQLEYLTSTSSWALVPDSALPGNSAGTTTSPVDISNVNRTTYNTIRLKASLACVSGNCPTLNDWTVTWAQGINVQGTVQQYNQSTNVTSGTVAVAVNGVLQAGKTAVISAGTFSIPNVTVFENDVVTVFIDGAADANEAVAVTKYDGDGDITGLQLYERHLSLGSADGLLITNANIGQYDNSISSDEDIFYDVDAGNDLSACILAGCADVEVYVRSGITYRPDSASSGNISTHDIEINGSLVADGNTISVSGSWDNNATFGRDASTVIFTATSSTETIDSTGATSTAFWNTTFGQTSGSATWNLSTALDVDGSISVQYGTFRQNGANAVSIGGNLTIGTNGIFTKGTATTTFDGTGTNVWTDSTAAKQDIGTVVIDGSAKTIQLGAGAKVTNITIGTDDTFSVDNNYALEVIGNWTNNNSFLAQNGTVTFTSTSTGRTIAPGSSSFYNITFNGGNGNWSFTGPVTAGNNFTIATGTVTLPNSTTTVTGNFDASTGAFMHNNGAMLFNASASRTINPGASSFYDMSFNGAGAWSFTSTNATSSRHVFISQGTLTLPSGTFAVGGSFLKTAGGLSHGNGTLKFTAATAQSVLFGGAWMNNLTFSGAGTWAMNDTSATTSGNVRFEQGTATLPSATFAVAGSWTNTGGSATAGSGTVKFVATSTGRTIAPGASTFANVIFDGIGGGWTVSGNATSTNALTIANTNSFTVSGGVTLAVGGVFSNAIGGATTTWTGSTLSLYSGSGYTANSKTTGGDTYGTIRIGANTDVRMWNSSAATTTVDSTGSLYSQDHAAVDGSAYIWGDFVISSNEYWAYANDFDGSPLSGGNQRQANIRIATTSVVTQTGGTLLMTGAASATTTVANQGAGRYAFNITGGTLNAQYYSFRNMATSGVAISGTPTITSLSNGDFELDINTGTMLAVSSSVINQNPALQIMYTRFATSTGITSGANVTETGSPTSYWWFRNHYGNYAGENFDVDPGGNPGFIRWDDSGFSVTVSGRVFSDEGVTPIGSPVCDGVTANVRVVVNYGAGVYNGSCNTSTGAYSIPGVSFTGDAVITAFLNTNGGARAVAVTRTPTGDVTNFDLYRDEVVVRHEDTSPMTIAQLALYDSTDDADIPMTAATGSPNTLSTAAGTELHVYTGKTFAPGGNITLNGGGGSVRDGMLHIATSSVFTAAGTESYTLGGGLSIASGATLTSASSTFTFNATSSNRLIYAAQAFSLYNATFNGTGSWSFNNGSATSTVSNAFTLTAGTVNGTGDIIVSNGGISGNGTVAMTGGTIALQGTGSFGNSTAWQFSNLTLGNGSSAGAMTKSGVGSTTVTGILRVAALETMNAGGSDWQLTGSGAPFVVTGIFNVQNSTFTYSGTSATTVADEDYAILYLAPGSAGTPTYTLQGGTMSATTLAVGGANPVSVTADANDPSVSVAGNLSVGIGSTFIASNTGALQVAGSWLNLGTFTPSGATVTFNATTTGKLIDAGSSSFYNVIFDGVAGGWTISQNATSTNSTTITNAASFTLSPNRTLAVGGTFTNSVGGSATTWATSTLSLFSGTAYSMNTKLTGGDTYGEIRIAANTDIRAWNSSAATTTVNATGSLYSQDHAGVDGSLNIWGEYVRSSGSDYWSYATDFDGAAIATSSMRAVAVRIATSSSISLTGGLLDMIGAPGATTTIANQGTGRYAFAVSGGTLNAQYYQVRNTDPSGLNISGSATVTTLSDGDYELGVQGGAMITVAGTVIDANPLKIFLRNNFSTSTGITAGYNVVETGSSVSSWKFNLHYGSYDGEAFDNDPAGDPGYIRWDDSSSAIAISGNVYSDEGVTVSTVCDGVTPVVSLKVQGAGSYTSACNASTGLYTISGIAFNPGDTLTVFLDTAGGRRAANVSVDPLTNITNMHLYENRVIVRHEDATPITIADMTLYDSDQDSDIPFNATDAVTDTLVLPPNTKLYVYDSKVFAPAGNITLTSGGSGSAWDGTLEVRPGATLSAAGTQSHSIGGSLLIDSGATLTPANSTFTFTATTTGKTVSLDTSSFYNVVFNGTGGNWAFSGGTMTAGNDFTIATGTVTLPTATSTIGGSFQNTGGTYMHNNGTVVMSATTGGKTVRQNNSTFYNLTFNGAGGTWSFFDTAATTSNNFVVTNGAVTAPSQLLSIGGSFDNQGTFTAGTNTMRFTANTTGKTVRAGGATLYNVAFHGTGGAWTFADASLTVSRDFSIFAGSTTLPTSALSVGGSWNTAGGAFTAGGATVTFNATTTGKTIDPGASSFTGIIFNSASGGWTVSQNATSTANTVITSASSFTLSPNRTLAVGGSFTNDVGGSATTWATSTLRLYSGTSFSINGKTTTDTYGTLIIATSTDVRMWRSSAATTTVDASGSLYSQDHSDVDGDVFIWGEYIRASGSDYWSYATDFDGAALGGSPRQVDVRIATSSSVTFSGGSLSIVGTAAATTTIANQGTGRYAFTVSGGTLNANYYQIRNTDPNGLNITGTPAVTSLDNGDYQLGVNGGAMIRVADTAIDANASAVINNVLFATSTGIASGFNVVRSGTPISAWTFNDHYGNYDGEAYDSDGIDTCGFIRWDDSACLFVSQEHYRWRADDGGLGSPNSTWYSASWSKRKRITVSNPTGSAMVNQPVEIQIPYDSDMQTDFDDLRFTDVSGTTTVPYWIEERTASATSTVWVKFASIPANDSASVYMYYGNPSVIDGGDGSATFKFFDDFEDDNVTEYSGQTSMFDTDTTFNHNYAYGLDAGISTELRTTSGGMYQTGSLTGLGDTIRFFQYMDAAAEDEPCTLFAVGAASQNYAVCLDQYPNELVTLRENVTSNDSTGAGDLMASTSVTYATGWYEVEVDWLSNNTINVYVYDSTGALFASLNATDSTRSSGGIGFSFWYQHGGWDFYSVRPYVASEPTYVFGGEQISGGASWHVNEDTSVSGITAGTNVRVRFSVVNTGAPLSSQNYRLQYAAKGAALNCESVAFNQYADVPAQGSCGTSAACMASSAQFGDQDAISDLLTFPGGMSFVSGRAMENLSNQSNGINMGSNSVTELEYNFQLTGFASANSYCFRTTAAGTSLDNYDRVAEVVMAHAPTISNWGLNGGFNIALTEGTTTLVSATGTVTDLNGYADIVYATSTIYRSGVGGQCSSNLNSCYKIASSSCTFSNCAGNSCTLSCTASVQYFADPTDAGSSFNLENWLASVYVVDQSGYSDTDLSFGVDMQTLYGLNVNTPFIDFGALSVGTNTGATTTISTILNTGNAPIDIQLAGTDLAGTTGTIAVGEQKYATSTFAYGSCSICNFLSGSATSMEVDLPKPTSTSSPVSDDVFWGINVPIGTKAELHAGTNTFIATSD